MVEKLAFVVAAAKVKLFEINLNKNKKVGLFPKITRIMNNFNNCVNKGSSYQQWHEYVKGINKIQT